MDAAMSRLDNLNLTSSERRVPQCTLPPRESSAGARRTLVSSALVSLSTSTSSVRRLWRVPGLHRTHDSEVERRCKYEYVVLRVLEPSMRHGPGPANTSPVAHISSSLSRVPRSTPPVSAGG